MADAVALETRPRGSADARRAGRLTWFVVVAALLHVPFTPLGGLIGLLALLRAPSHETPQDSLNAIPVSLLSPEELAALGGPTPLTPPGTPPPPAPEARESEPAALPSEPEPAPKPKPKPKPKPVAVVSDAGTPDAADAAPPMPPAPSVPLQHPADAGAAAPAASGSAPEKPDPMALVGSAASVADANANVKLLLMNQRIRETPLAPRIGRLVSRLPQWSSFFGPTKLDPIRDIERLYVAGPQFRVSAEVVAVLEYRVSQATMHQAIDAVVNRPPKGEWLDTKVPAARARADRAERVFVLPKGKAHTLLMVPPRLAEDAIAKASSMTLPAVGGQAAVVAFVATPWRALAGLRLPVEVPHSIASVALTLTPTEEGGAVLHVDAADESPELAREHATLLTTAINTLTQQNVGDIGALFFGGKTLSLIEPIELRAEGKRVVGDARVTPRQLDRILGFAEGWVDAITGGPPPTPSVAPVSRPTAPR